MPNFPVVTPGNLGADFDVGFQVGGKINIVAATTAAAGKVRLAAAADITAGTAGVAVDAAALKTAIAPFQGAQVLQGAWNPVTNTPQLLSGVGTAGYVYKLSANGVSIATTASAAVNAANVVPVASATGIVPGQQLTATGVTGTVTVVSVSGSNVTLSGNVTLANAAALTFATYLDGAGPFYAGDTVAYGAATSSWSKYDGAAETSVNVTDTFGAHLYYAAP